MNIAEKGGSTAGKLGSKTSNWERYDRQRIHENVELSVFAALAILIYSFEALLFAALPWFRWGLSNVIILLCLVRFGIYRSLLISLLRHIVSSLILGIFFTPMALLALFCGIISTLVMGIALRFGSKVLSLIGISALGAFSHSLTLFLIASYFIVKSPLLLKILPLFLFLAILSGSINGLMAQIILSHLGSLPLTWKLKEHILAVAPQANEEKNYKSGG